MSHFLAPLQRVYETRQHVIRNIEDDISKLLEETLSSVSDGGDFYHYCSKEEAGQVATSCGDIKARVVKLVEAIFDTGGDDRRGIPRITEKAVDAMTTLHDQTQKHIDDILKPFHEREREQKRLKHALAVFACCIGDYKRLSDELTRTVKSGRTEASLNALISVAKSFPWRDSEADVRPDAVSRLGTACEDASRSLEITLRKNFGIAQWQAPAVSWQTVAQMTSAFEKRCRRIIRDGMLDDAAKNKNKKQKTNELSTEISGTLSGTGSQSNVAPIPSLERSERDTLVLPQRKAVRRRNRDSGDGVKELLDGIAAEVAEEVEKRKGLPKKKKKQGKKAGSKRAGALLERLNANHVVSLHRNDGKPVERGKGHPFFLRPSDSYKLDRLLMEATLAMNYLVPARHIYDAETHMPVKPAQLQGGMDLIVTCGERLRLPFVPKAELDPDWRGQPPHDALAWVGSYGVKRQKMRLEEVLGSINGLTRYLKVYGCYIESTNSSVRSRRLSPASPRFVYGSLESSSRSPVSPLSFSLGGLSSSPRSPSFPTSSLPLFLDKDPQNHPSHTYPPPQGLSRARPSSARARIGPSGDDGDVDGVFLGGLTLPVRPFSARVVPSSRLSDSVRCYIGDSPRQSFSRTSRMISTSKSSSSASSTPFSLRRSPQRMSATRGVLSAGNSPLQTQRDMEHWHYDRARSQSLHSGTVAKKQVSIVKNSYDASKVQKQHKSCQQGRSKSARASGELTEEEKHDLKRRKNVQRPRSKPTSAFVGGTCDGEQSGIDHYEDSDDATYSYHLSSGESSSGSVDDSENVRKGICRPCCRTSESNQNMSASGIALSRGRIMKAAEFSSKQHEKLSASSVRKRVGPFSARQFKEEPKSATRATKSADTHRRRRSSLNTKITTFKAPKTRNSPAINSADVVGETSEILKEKRNALGPWKYSSSPEDLSELRGRELKSPVQIIGDAFAPLKQAETPDELRKSQEYLSDHFVNAKSKLGGALCKDTIKNVMKVLNIKGSVDTMLQQTPRNRQRMSNNGLPPMMPRLTHAMSCKRPASTPRRTRSSGNNSIVDAEGELHDLRRWIHQITTSDEVDENSQDCDCLQVPNSNSAIESRSLMYRNRQTLESRTHSRAPLSRDMNVGGGHKTDPVPITMTRDGADSEADPNAGIQYPDSVESTLKRTPYEKGHKDLSKETNAATGGSGGLRTRELYRATMEGLTEMETRLEVAVRDFKAVAENVKKFQSLLRLSREMEAELVQKKSRLAFLRMSRADHMRELMGGIVSQTIEKCFGLLHLSTPPAMPTLASANGSKKIDQAAITRTLPIIIIDCSAKLSSDYRAMLRRIFHFLSTEALPRRTSFAYTILTRQTTALGIKTVLVPVVPSTPDMLVKTLLQDCDVVPTHARDGECCGDAELVSTMESEKLRADYSTSIHIPGAACAMNQSFRGKSPKRSPNSNVKPPSVPQKHELTATNSAGQLSRSLSAGSTKSRGEAASTPKKDTKLTATISHCDHLSGADLNLSARLAAGMRQAVEHGDGIQLLPGEPLPLPPRASLGSTGFSPRTAKMRLVRATEYNSSSRKLVPLSSEWSQSELENRVRRRDPRGIGLNSFTSRTNLCRTDSVPLAGDDKSTLKPEHHKHIHTNPSPVPSVGAPPPGAQLSAQSSFFGLDTFSVSETTEDLLLQGIETDTAWMGSLRAWAHDDSDACIRKGGNNSDYSRALRAGFRAAEGLKSYIQTVWDAAQRQQEQSVVRVECALSNSTSVDGMTDPADCASLHENSIPTSPAQLGTSHCKQSGIAPTQVTQYDSQTHVDSDVHGVKPSCPKQPKSRNSVPLKLPARSQPVSPALSISASESPSSSLVRHAASIPRSNSAGNQPSKPTSSSSTSLGLGRGGRRLRTRSATNSSTNTHRDLVDQLRPSPTHPIGGNRSSHSSRNLSAQTSCNSLRYSVNPSVSDRNSPAHVPCSDEEAHFDGEQDHTVSCRTYLPSLCCKVEIYYITNSCHQVAIDQSVIEVNARKKDEEIWQRIQRSNNVRLRCRGGGIDSFRRQCKAAFTAHEEEVQRKKEEEAKAKLEAKYRNQFDSWARGEMEEPGPLLQAEGLVSGTTPTTCPDLNSAYTAEPVVSLKKHASAPKSHSDHVKLHPAKQIDSFVTDDSPVLPVWESDLVNIETKREACINHSEAGMTLYGLESLLGLNLSKLPEDCVTCRSPEDSKGMHYCDDQCNHSPSTQRSYTAGRTKVSGVPPSETPCSDGTSSLANNNTSGDSENVEDCKNEYHEDDQIAVNTVALGVDPRGHDLLRAVAHHTGGKFRIPELRGVAPLDRLTAAGRACDIVDATVQGQARRREEEDILASLKRIETLQAETKISIQEVERQLRRMDALQPTSLIDPENAELVASQLTLAETELQRVRTVKKRVEQTGACETTFPSAFRGVGLDTYIGWISPDVTSHLTLRESRTGRPPTTLSSEDATVLTEPEPTPSLTLADVSTQLPGCWKIDLQLTSEAVDLARWLHTAAFPAPLTACNAPLRDVIPMLWKSIARLRSPRDTAIDHKANKRLQDVFERTRIGGGGDVSGDRIRDYASYSWNVDK